MCITPKADVTHIRYRTKKETNPKRLEMFARWKEEAGELLGKKYAKYGLKLGKSGNVVRYMAAFETKGYVRPSWRKTKAGIAAGEVEWKKRKKRKRLKKVRK